MQQWNTPSGFLQWGGVLLIALGIVGFFLLGPTPQASAFGDAWWFDNVENAAHLVIGTIALVLSFGIRNHGINTKVALIIGLFAVFAAVWGAFSPDFLGAHLEMPGDTVLHAALGMWALSSVFRK